MTNCKISKTSSLKSKSPNPILPPEPPNRCITPFQDVVTSACASASPASSPCTSNYLHLNCPKETFLKLPKPTSFNSSSSSRLSKVLPSASTSQRLHTHSPLLFLFIFLSLITPSFRLVASIPLLDPSKPLARHSAPSSGSIRSRRQAASAAVSTGSLMAIEQGPLKALVRPGNWRRSIFYE